MKQTIQGNPRRFYTPVVEGICPDSDCTHTNDRNGTWISLDGSFEYTRRICRECNLTTQLTINGDTQDITFSREVPAGRLLAVRVATNPELVTGSPPELTQVPIPTEADIAETRRRFLESIQAMKTT